MLVQLTRKQEREVTRWIVMSLKTRPKDWSITRYNCSDTRTDISLYVENPGAIRLSAPFETKRFRLLSRIALYAAVRQFRDRTNADTGCKQIKELYDEMAKAPLPTIASKAEE